jgi:hypothetical protein
LSENAESGLFFYQAIKGFLTDVKRELVDQFSVFDAGAV